MSIESVSRVLPIQGLPPAQKLCLIGIANHDGDGGAWPSIKTLAMYVGVSERQAQRLVATLVDRGLISVEINAGGNAKTPKNYRPNLYRLHLEGVTSVTPLDDRGDISDAVGVTSSAVRGDIAVSPEPSLTIQEPSLSSIADALAKEWWDSKAEKPSQPFLAARGAIRKQLAHWSEERVRDALRDIPVVSGGAFDLWASKHPAPPPPQWSTKPLIDELITWAQPIPAWDKWLLNNQANYERRMVSRHDEGFSDEMVVDDVRTHIMRQTGFQ